MSNNSNCIETEALSLKHQSNPFLVIFEKAVVKKCNLMVWKISLVRNIGNLCGNITSCKGTMCREG